MSSKVKEHTITPRSIRFKPVKEHTVIPRFARSKLNIKEHTLTPLTFAKNGYQKFKGDQTLKVT